MSSQSFRGAGNCDQLVRKTDHVDANALGQHRRGLVVGGTREEVGNNVGREAVFRQGMDTIVVDTAYVQIQNRKI